MNQERKRRILQFVEDKGFYIILALCVTAIGISGYVLFFLMNVDLISEIILHMELLMILILINVYMCGGFIYILLIIFLSFKVFIIETRNYVLL